MFAPLRRLAAAGFLAAAVLREAGTYEAALEALRHHLLDAEPTPWTQGEYQQTLAQLEQLARGRAALCKLRDLYGPAPPPAQRREGIPPLWTVRSRP